MVTPPFYIPDLPGLREKLARAERDNLPLGRLWSGVRRRARFAPNDFPWFTPLVALVSGEESDIAPAREVIRSYARTMDVQPFGSGLQFHFWCFAFPHARWALYFQWLGSMGAWDADEERSLAEEFVSQAFTNFHFGMRTKPDPECVDNQTMSLCFCNALVGLLFKGAPLHSAVAERMYGEGLRRLPGMIGGMPSSGYSGEGSTYMDAVVGPAIPFLVELLEATQGGDWFNRTLEPAGGSAAAICRMIAREWMPNGLVLPWDHYGYQLPMRSCVAYAAHKTGDPFYFDLLENHASYSHDGMVGWGFDDLIWTLVWWPGERPAAHARVFPSWAEPELGAALVSQDSQLYLMQMWDHSEPVYPSRSHVNPNSVVLSAYGVPLSVDGIPSATCDFFDYEDTYREVSYMDLSSRRFNFGSGCAGAHSVLLVDGWEGMRAGSDYAQASLVAFDETSVTADVTPLYRERWPDAVTLRRRSSLVADRFWLIEDLAQFTEEHDVTARFWLRPSLVPSAGGVQIETAEGVRLNLLPLLGEDEGLVRLIEGYPDRLDGAALCADWTARGREVRWLWLAFPAAGRRVQEFIADGWTAAADTAGDLTPDEARALLGESTLHPPLTAPADMLMDVSPCERWWYRRTVTVPDAPAWWLRLPRQMDLPRLFVNGQEVDLAEHDPRQHLLAPEVQMPAGLRPGSRVEVMLYTEVSIAQYEAGGAGGTGFSGQPAILVPRPSPQPEASYREGRVRVRCGAETWDIPYKLLAGREAAVATAGERELMPA